MYQQITVCGNLGQDPELRQTNQGQDVCDFSVATSRTWTDDKNERQEQTTWFRVTVWGNQAQSCAQYLRKGNKVLAVGEMKEPNVWTDQQGNARASLEMTARTVRFLTPRQENEQQGYQQNTGYQQNNQANQQQQQQQSPPPQQQQESTGVPDEEIPF